MLDQDQILAIIGSELSQSAGGDESDFIDSNRRAALGAYLGQADGKETEGRSTIVSTDVADAVEWIMPEVLKAFTQNNEVVAFDPAGSGDEKQAELESKYVYDILMKDNDGFIVLHQFFKDALIQKNGFVKVFYSDDVISSEESYNGINEIDMQMILSDPDLELIERSESEEQSQIPLFDIKVKRETIDSRMNVVSIPPEKFRVDRQHNSVNVNGARFSAHVELKTASDLIEMGLTKEQVDEIPSAETFDDDSDYRFYLQDEDTSSLREGSLDPSSRIIEVAECYIRIDINEDGIAEYMKITVAGGDNPTHLIDMEPLDVSPVVSSTAILMSHKLFGLSIYDRLRQIQEQKTALWRNIFDNMYLQNNQRTSVVENQVNMDDLLISRPGGVVRVKVQGAMAPIITPPLSPESYNMMDYLDKVRAGRAGVTPEGPISDNMIGDRVGSEGVEKLMSQKEELVGLMIRVFAETGIKPICYKIRQGVIKHQDVAKEYMFRGEWVKVNPASWRNKRATSTVRVGTGSGNRKAQQGAITQLMLIQEKMLMNPAQALVKEQQVFDAIDDFAKFSGLPGASKYFLDPMSPQGQQNKQQVDQQNKAAQEAEQKEKVALAEAQTKIANAEMQKAQATMANVQLKAQIEDLKLQLAGSKQMSDQELASVKQDLEEAKALLGAKEKAQELEFKYWQTKEQLEVQKLSITSNKQKGETR